MSRTSIAPSRRLLSAVRAEHDRLARERERLLGRRERAADALAGLDAQLALLDRRLRDLDDAAPPAARPPEAPAEGRATLSGPAIRETAVRVALERHAGPALHYRDWYQLLVDAGHAVAGSDPLAVFLTQVSRSPCVLKSTERGVYVIDPQTARRRLQGRLGQLREASAAATGGDLLEAAREITRVEREIEEIDRCRT